MPPYNQQPAYPPQQPQMPIAPDQGAPLQQNPALTMPPQSPGAPSFDPQGMPPAPGAAQQPQPQQQQTPQQPQAKKQASTQNSLLLSELRDGMIIMADGSFRAVIACESINFDLMSSREREAVEYSYQNFLNALYFPIQILVRSQRVDIGPYLDKLEGVRRGQDNMLLNVLMDDYIQFVDILSQEANIMDKSFFVVVPYYPSGNLDTVVEQSKGLFGKLFGGSSNSAVTKIDKDTYTKAKDEIKNRVDSVRSGLTQVGVRAVQLNTKELGELYYNVYNPDTAVREPLGDFNSITSTYVRKGETMPPQPGGM